MESIKHIWFDLSQTLTVINREKHAQIRYGAYAEVVGKPVTEELKKEYDALYAKHKSHSAIFVSLGKSVDFWSERCASVGPELFKLAEPDLVEKLNKLRSKLPISVFSNVLAEKFLPALGISVETFTHILGPKEVTKPKPDPQGFHLLVERSKLPAEDILFIGDDVEKEIKPAKSVGLQTGLMWQDSPEADFSFHSFKDVLKLFNL